MSVDLNMHARPATGLIGVALMALVSACGGEASTSPPPEDGAALADSGGAADDGVSAPESDAVNEPDAEAHDAAAGADLSDVVAEDVASSPAEALCAATGGAWEAGACDCRQTPEATRLEASFDAELGCLPDAARLCADTGGVWEDEACACAQDGATLFFEFDQRRGCGFPDDAALTADILSENLLALVTRYASAAQRVWLIDSAGVFMHIEPFDDPAELAARLAPNWASVSTSAGACSGALVREALPEVACENDAGMAPTGCFLVTTRGDWDRVSMLMKAAVEYDFADWEAAEIARAEADERQILKVHVASSHRVTLAFRRLSGTWVLVAIDLARYGCSA
jgi:hypothetical protein